MNAPTRVSEGSTAGTAEMTPMMAQYFEIRSLNPDCLLFYRMGDFYELFFDDAEVASQALGITLTKRGKHQGEDIAMCGVPVHAANDYLNQLIRLGHRVAVCEQVEDPAEAKKRGSKSVVKRDVVRLVTPGTLTEDELLPPGRGNFIAALALLLHDGADLALAYADISTGEVTVETVEPGALGDFLARLEPAELIVTAHARDWLRQELRADPLADQPLVIAEPDLLATRDAASRIATSIEPDRFDPSVLGATGRTALAALTTYVARTQKGAAVPWRIPRTRAPATMQIDAATRLSLELHRTQRGEARGSLLATLDACRTSAGSRLLAARLSAPSCDVGEIQARLAAVATLSADMLLTARLRDVLRPMPDLGRALTRLSLGRGGPRDLKAVALAIDGAHELAGLTLKGAAGTERLEKLATTLSTAPGHLGENLASALSDDLPLLARDGGFIRSGHNSELDGHRDLAGESRTYIARLQADYQQLTGVKSLKLKHNNVLGYFVEVPAAHGPALQSGEGAETFIHRQTMANAMRFSTVELGDLEGRINRASAAAVDLELSLFAELREAVLAETRLLQTVADALAELDLHAALGLIAAERSYCRPQVDESLAFEIESGRHAVVERVLIDTGGGRFVPNDCDLGGSVDTTGRLWLLTGPNMGGKSTFLRQNALIAIMAQTGSFVPATSAHIGVVDRVFSRVGAGDDIARGRSTFMVEMIETAAILNRATARSLVVLDEIGRGTSTFDGLSIAWAAVEALSGQNRCRALFATHYHELTALADRLETVSNHTMRVKEHEGHVIFLHEVGRGAADRSYGIHVARLAGLPEPVLERAREVLHFLETKADGNASLGTDLPLFSARPTQAAKKPRTDPVAERLATANPDEMTPRQAIDLIYELKSLARDRTE